MQLTDYRPAVGALRRRAARDRRLLDRDSLTYKVLFAWFNMSKSTRQLICKDPSEGYLLVLLLMSDMAFFLSWTMRAVIVPNKSGVSVISLEIGGLLILSLLGRTALMYLFAMVAGAIARIFGGSGTWRNTRIAVFWAAFVTAPFGVMAAILSVLFTNLEFYYPIFGGAWIALPPYYLGVLPFVWYVSLAVARAHGFRKVSPIFLIMSVVSLVAIVGGMYFHARGLI